MENRLATAEWAHPDDVATNLPYQKGRFWLGRSLEVRGTPVGYNDDRHICLVSGTRGGKGTTTIIPNLCLWPGSVVVVDPKGENATVTAARRGSGSEHCEGMGQTVHVLDPYRTAKVDADLRSRFNPLDALDPDDPHCVRNAERIAAALVPPSKAEEKFWENGARRLIAGLVLHVLTAPEFEDRRNLVTVRELVFRGDVATVRLLKEQGSDNIPSGHDLLWAGMVENEAFGGYVAGVGERYRGQAINAPKQWEGILDEAVNATGFINNPGMAECLSASDFSLSDLKTDPNGVSLYLSIPQRFMTEDFRWLRMMIALTTTEMEAVAGLPATGHRILMCLDEFAGLKRMEVIENAIAQMAGYGLKMFIVLQNLTQLKKHYEHSWETFLGNSGLKVFYAVDDHFTRDYVSKLVGKTERIREVESHNESVGESESQSETQTESISRSETSSTTDSESRSVSRSESESHSQSHSRSQSQTRGRNFSKSRTRGQNYGQTYRSGLLFDNITGRNRGNSHSRSVTEGNSRSWTQGTTDGETRGRTSGRTEGETHGSSTTEGVSTTNGSSSSRGVTQGRSRNVGRGSSETVHRVPLVAPSEVGLKFARVDDPDDPRYPGLALVMVSGHSPIVLRKTAYFEDGKFYKLYDPHPDYGHLLAPWQILELAKPEQEYLNYLRLDEGIEVSTHKRSEDLIDIAEPYLSLRISGREERYDLRSPVSGFVRDVARGKIPDDELSVVCADDSNEVENEESRLVVHDEDLTADVLTRKVPNESVIEDNREILKEACRDKKRRYMMRLKSFDSDLPHEIKWLYAGGGVLLAGIVGSFFSGFFHVFTVLALLETGMVAHDAGYKDWRYTIPPIAITAAIFHWAFLLLALGSIAGIIYIAKKEKEAEAVRVERHNEPLEKRIALCPETS